MASQLTHCESTQKGLFGSSLAQASSSAQPGIAVVEPVPVEESGPVVVVVEVPVVMSPVDEPPVVGEVVVELVDDSVVSPSEPELVSVVVLIVGGQPAKRGAAAKQAIVQSFRVIQRLLVHRRACGGCPGQGGLSSPEVQRGAGAHGAQGSSAPG